MKDDDPEIAVVGIGCNFPGGEGLDHFWKVLIEGKNCAVQIPVERFDYTQWYDQDDTKAGKSRTAKAALAEGFNQLDHKFFGINDAEVEQMDPQQKILLQCTYRALENAGIPMEKASGCRTGVFLGLMNRDYELIMANANPVIINHCTGTGLAMSIAANRISYVFNFTGPSFAIDCACSSSLVALHLACQAIKQGDCEMAVCGGVSCIFQPRVFVALSKANMISPNGTSKPFSDKADGYGRGEGCGVILLKPLNKALQDHDHIWGIICKTAVNQDGHTVTPITKPSMIQQEKLLQRIYSTKTYLSDVQYIEAHGTGTSVGDPIEASSISKVISKARPADLGPLCIGSVKVTGEKVCPTDFVNGIYWARNIREPVAFKQAVKSAKQNKNAIFVEIGPRRALQRNIKENLGNDTVVLSSVEPDKDHETMLTVVSKLFEMGVNVDWDQFYKGSEVKPIFLPRYLFDNEKKDVLIEATHNDTRSSHPVITQKSKDGLVFSCDLSSEALSYLNDHKHQGVAIIPGAFYVELGLAAFMMSAKPKVPLNYLQLSIRFHTPCILSQNIPAMKVLLDPTEDTAENSFQYKVHSLSSYYASGKVEAVQKRPEEQYISLKCIYKRCQSVVSSEEFYKYLCLGGFQYSSVFKNKGDVYYGEELRESYSVVTVPDKLWPHLYDYYLHPVVLDYFMQILPVTGTQNFLGRPGFPSQIGSLTVFEPLQKEMVVYLRATDMSTEELNVCGCFADKEGRVLVELKHVTITYLGDPSHVVKEYFYHNSYSIPFENENFSTPKSLVFADKLGISKGLQQYLDPSSKYISPTHAKALMENGFEVFLSEMKIPNIKANFQDVLFMWGIADMTSYKTENVLDSMANSCEIFRKIVAGLKTIHFQSSIRVVTYRSSEDTVDHISPGFVLSGMIRACAAEITELSFQLIDIGSVSEEDIKAFAQILRSYPCSKYPELIVKNGLIYKPQIIQTPITTTDSASQSLHSSQCESFIVQTSDPHRMTRLSAIGSDEIVQPVGAKNVEIQLCKIAVHSSDYFPVSVSDLNFGQTLYWSKHTSQNHKLLALDFSGTVTAVGKDVRKLKLGDKIVCCYPVTASSKVVIPAAACYKTKRLPFLKETPCVSYIILAWEVLHCALPMTKQRMKLGIFSTIPDSVLVKVLTLTAIKSGWSVTVGTNANQLTSDCHEVVRIVLLPPYDEGVIAQTANINGVRDIVLVSDNQTSVSQLDLRGYNDEVFMKVLFTSNILQKQSITAHKSCISNWLKHMHLDKRSVFFEKTTFQKLANGNIDCFPLDESKSYFRCQTMPVVVLGDDTKDELSDILLMQKVQKLFQKNSVYIVTGGLSGLGFETVKFIAQRGGGNIVILSRNSPNELMELEIKNVKNQCQSIITSLQCDVSAPEQVYHTIAQIKKLFSSNPIKGVFHSAVVLHDGLIESLNKSLYEKVMRPKVNGVINLHHATKHCDLDYFVCYSSISAFIGNASQTNYAAANTFLDTFCQYRRNMGLPGQSINWGALNLGLLLNKEHFQRFLEAKGMMILEVPEIHQSLEQCLLMNKPQQVVCKFNFKNIRYNVLSQNKSLTSRLSALVEEGLRKATTLNSNLEQFNTFSSPNEYIKSVISNTTGVEQNELSDDTPLSVLGIDSMLAMTLQNLIFQEKESEQNTLNYESTAP
ncbi:hypothetical protein P4O66_001360 [Electrophorus voltai]|uniref:Carrier domain-containing protein n=1 Tax=Electrophorus voltai TaxID=2609070 RepID=A0AAD9DVT3_9TELE|nr:hypothetical protein P4O66_001360 [Electrophorus voltai]